MNLRDKPTPRPHVHNWKPYTRRASSSRPAIAADMPGSGGWRVLHRVCDGCGTVMHCTIRQVDLAEFPAVCKWMDKDPGPPWREGTSEPLPEWDFHGPLFAQYSMPAPELPGTPTYFFGTASDGEPYVQLLHDWKPLP